MTYSVDVQIVEIVAGSDPAGNVHTKVSFGYRLKLPMPPMPQTAQGVPMPTPIAWQHAMHLFIPKEEWVGQFQMWENYHLIVQDDGHAELKKAI